MKSNIDRRNEIFKDVIPSKGDVNYERLMSSHEKRMQRQSPAEKKFFKDCLKKAVNSLEAQYLSHSGFITETTLRHFLMEYNNRAREHGLRSMPLLFNILESFFIYRKPHIYFELIEEENYLISFFDFLDFITSKTFENDKNLILDNLVPDIVYNFNIGVDLKEISFKSDNNAEFIISGVSIIRRENEVTVLLITGCNEFKTIEITDLKLETTNPDKADLLNKYKKDVKGKEQKPLFIDDNKNYSKVIVACRIDLENDSIDARYVAEEYENFFQINTDESDAFTNQKGEYTSDSYKELHENGIKRVELFNAIFEVAKSALYLPYYLNENEENLIEESHETEFSKTKSSPLKRRKFKDTFGYKTSNKPLYVINSNNKFSPDVIKLRDDLFRIETSGHWKNLSIDEVGLDKKGNSIHGKTWVNQKLSWFESNTNELIVEKNKNQFTGKDSGFIYIIRNPTMGANIFKIGLTRNEVEERIKQLSKTSVPDKFYKAQEWNVKNCVTAEKEIHNLLEKFRIDPRREFFEINYEVAVETITKVCNEINKNNA
ncbi:MAG: GIY-YIG nuclease family protein [Algibacter sp.]